MLPEARGNYDLLCDSLVDEFDNQQKRHNHMIKLSKLKQEPFEKVAKFAERIARMAEAAYG